MIGLVVVIAIMMAAMHPATQPVSHPTTHRTQKPVDETAAAKTELKSLEEWTSEFNKLTGNDLFRGVSIDGKNCKATLDADYWDPMSDQDKNLVFTHFLQFCGGVYMKHHPGGSPEGGNVTFYDLAGNQIKWDIISAP